MHTASDPLYWNVICTHVWYRHLLLYKLRDVRVNVSLTTNGNSPDLWMLLIFTLSSRSRIWWHFNPHRCDKEEENVVIILEMYASPEYTQRKKKKQEEAKKKKKKKFIYSPSNNNNPNQSIWMEKTRQRCCWLQLLLHSMKNVCTELFQPIVVFHQSMKVHTRQSAGHTT